MKFIWEPDDIRPGRRVQLNRKSPADLGEYMIFADNALGNAARFGLICLGTGLVLHKGETTTQLADRMNDEGIRWAPITVNDDD